MNGHCTYSSGRVKEVRDRARTLSLAWGPHSAWPGVDFMFLNVVKKKTKAEQKQRSMCSSSLLWPAKSETFTVGSRTEAFWLSGDCGACAGRLLTHGSLSWTVLFCNRVKVKTWKLLCSHWFWCLSVWWSTAQPATGCSVWPLSGPEASQCGLRASRDPFSTLVRSGLFYNRTALFSCFSVLIFALMV